VFRPEYSARISHAAQEGGGGAGGCGALRAREELAGLVRGAAEGAGLGNAFLSHIAAVDGIFHVVRALARLP
jgi:hypothetical protein